MKCDILQQSDRGAAGGPCGRPAKFVLNDGRPACGIHGRRVPSAYRLPISHPAAVEFATHTHNPFIEGEWCGPRLRFSAALGER